MSVRCGQVPDVAVDQIAALLVIADTSLREGRDALMEIVDVADLERLIGPTGFVYVVVTPTGVCAARGLRNTAEVLEALDVAARFAVANGLLFEVRTVLAGDMRAQVVACAQQLALELSTAVGRA